MDATFFQPRLHCQWNQSVRAEHIFSKSSKTPTKMKIIALYLPAWVVLSMEPVFARWAPIFYGNTTTHFFQCQHTQRIMAFIEICSEIALRAKIARLIALESLFQLLFHRDTHPSSRMIWFPCHNYYNSSTNYVCIETKFVSNSSQCFYWTMLCSKILIHLHSRWMICFTLKRETRTKRLSAKKHIQNY